MALAAEAEPARTPSETEPPTDAAPLPSWRKSRAVAASAAVVPGVLVHGAGSYVAGETKTATALLVAEGAGLLMVAAGLSTIYLSGNSRYLAGPAMAATALGGGLFLVSFGADLYGTLSTDGEAVDGLPRTLPTIESEIGYRQVFDPVFDYRHFLVERLNLRSGRFRVTPAGWFSTAGDTVQFRVEGAYRFLGAQPHERSRTSDHVDLVVGGIYYRYIPEHFPRNCIEAALDARYDLGNLGRTLRGAFVDVRLGYAGARIDYELTGRDVQMDYDGLLLAKIGMGVLLRGKAANGSEVKVYYDHRHDELSGGLVLQGLESGVAGKFGGELRWFFSDRVGLLWQGEVGSAVTLGLSALIRPTLPQSTRGAP